MVIYGCGVVSSTSSEFIWLQYDGGAVGRYEPQQSRERTSYYYDLTIKLCEAVRREFRGDELIEERRHRDACLGGLVAKLDHPRVVVLVHLGVGVHVGS